MVSFGLFCIVDVIKWYSNLIVIINFVFFYDVMVRFIVSEKSKGNCKCYFVKFFIRRIFVYVIIDWCSRNCFRLWYFLFFLDIFMLNIVNELFVIDYRVNLLCMMVLILFFRKMFL